MKKQGIAKLHQKTGRTCLIVFVCYSWFKNGPDYTPSVGLLMVPYSFLSIPVSLVLTEWLESDSTNCLCWRVIPLSFSFTINEATNRGIGS